jgi:hypothetical protein
MPDRQQHSDEGAETGTETGAETLRTGQRHIPTVQEEDHRICESLHSEYSMSLEQIAMSSAAPKLIISNASLHPQASMEATRTSRVR